MKPRIPNRGRAIANHTRQFGFKKTAKATSLVHINITSPENHRCQQQDSDHKSLENAYGGEMSISKHAASSIALNLAFVYHAQHWLSCDLAEKYYLSSTRPQTNKARCYFSASAND
jgi:hypothetical protein